MEESKSARQSRNRFSDISIDITSKFRFEYFDIKYGRVHRWVGVYVCYYADVHLFIYFHISIFFYIYCKFILHNKILLTLVVKPIVVVY